MQLKEKHFFVKILKEAYSCWQIPELILLVNTGYLELKIIYANLCQLNKILK